MKLFKYKRGIHIQVGFTYPCWPLKGEDSATVSSVVCPMLYFWSYLVSESCLTLLQPHGLYPASLLCPWNFSGQNTGVGCHFLLQRIFSTQGSNPGLLHWQADPLPLSRQGSPCCVFRLLLIPCDHIFRASWKVKFFKAIGFEYINAFFFSQR